MNRPRAAAIVLDEHSLNLPRPHQASPGPMWAQGRTDLTPCDVIAPLSLGSRRSRRSSPPGKWSGGRGNRRDV